VREWSVESDGHPAAASGDPRGRSDADARRSFGQVKGGRPGGRADARRSSRRQGSSRRGKRGGLGDHQLSCRRWGNPTGPSPRTVTKVTGPHLSSRAAGLPSVGRPIPPPGSGGRPMDTTQELRRRPCGSVRTSFGRAAPRGSGRGGCGERLPIRARELDRARLGLRLPTRPLASGGRGAGSPSAWSCLRMRCRPTRGIRASRSGPLLQCERIAVPAAARLRDGQP